MKRFTNPWTDGKVDEKTERYAGTVQLAGEIACEKLNPCSANLSR
jgi:hypothetical protein